MARHPLTLVAFTLLLSATPLGAQTLPNFAGTWSLDVSRSNVQKETAKTLVIVQTPEAVTIERHVEGQQEVMNYPFKPTAAILPNAEAPKEPDTLQGPPVADQPGGPTGVQSTAAEWKNGGLETTAVLMINGKAVTHRTRRTLNLTGTEMTVETVLAVQHGYQNGESSGTGREVYVKQPK